MDEIDFENFSVEKEKADEIRRRIEVIKGQDLVNSLKLLCSEFGYEVETSGEQESFPGMGKGPKDLCFEICSLSNQRDYAIELSGNELRFSMAGSLICDVSFLPKDNEILVGFVHPELWASFLEEQDSFDQVIALAKRRKSDRQKVWKARFSN